MSPNPISHVYSRAPVEWKFILLITMWWTSQADYSVIVFPVPEVHHSTIHERSDSTDRRRTDLAAGISYSYTHTCFQDSGEISTRPPSKRQRNFYARIFHRVPSSVPRSNWFSDNHHFYSIASRTRGIGIIISRG